ncbi:hypothetical protein M3I54_01945 [Paraburkholderia sp. CNPSo 3274]|uniref:hypothetical protein n=1 Tax=Paraburkholderia sp. CNPSo 3274 TaxID=2940932 RepID=UPI0020B8F68E|nr:hypothetical protein [Paraburkholderia sp. CNPSo 3274]MCP3705761.1 hypothetical protein [Paraburkholderia sp. CNPSo 3274]
MKPCLLVLILLADEDLAGYGEHFDVIYAPDADARAKAVAERGKDVRVVLTNASRAKALGRATSRA